MKGLKVSRIRTPGGAGVAFFAAALCIFIASQVAAVGKGSADKAPESESATAEPSIQISVSGAGDCHSQGIAVFSGRLYISCVERKTRRAVIYSYKWPGELEVEVALTEPQITDVTRDRMYHPSGLDHDGECLWVASSHYRSFMARSTVICLDPESMEERSSFMVDDHVGSIGVLGDELALMNWDAKLIYRYTKDGEFVGRRPSPTGVAYQDCKGMGGNKILCSGIGKVGKSAVVDLLSLDPETGWQLKRRTLILHPELSLGREGFTILPGHWAFLPQDLPEAKLMIYSPPVSWP